MYQLNSTRLSACMLAAVIFFLAEDAADAQSRYSDTFCIVPVSHDGDLRKFEDGANIWRVLSKVVMLPYISRPVIYPYGLKGIWTVDENNRFRRFGGDFPENFIHDKFATDGVHGRTIGINSFKGVFSIRPGETEFTRIFAADSAPLGRPFGVDFIPRFDAFVIHASNGLFTLDSGDVLKPLPSVNRQGTPTFGRVFDLPSIGALLADTGSDAIYLRYDDGVSVLIATKERVDFVKSASVSAGKQHISIVTQYNAFDVSVPERGASLPDVIKEPPGARASRPRPKAPTTISPVRNTEGFRRITAASIGKVILFNEHDVFEEDQSRNRRRIALPFDSASPNIISAVEMPASKVVLFFLDRGVIALSKDDQAYFVRGGSAVSSDRLTTSKGLIPVRNAALLQANNSIFLFLDRSISQGFECKSPDGSLLQ